MKNLVLFLAGVGFAAFILLHDQSHSSSSHDSDIILTSAMTAANEVDDPCEDTDKEYEVVLLSGDHGGRMHCNEAYDYAAMNCIGTHIRIKRDLVVYPSHLVFITKRATCSNKRSK